MSEEIKREVERRKRQEIANRRANRTAGIATVVCAALLVYVLLIHPHVSAG